MAIVTEARFQMGDAPLYTQAQFNAAIDALLIQIEVEKQSAFTSGFQAGADARAKQCAEIATKKAETLRKAAHVVQQPTEDALRMAELAILTADDCAAAILQLVGQPVEVKE